MNAFDPPADPCGDERLCRICDWPLEYNALIRDWECINDHDTDNEMDEQIWTSPNQRLLTAAANDLLVALKAATVELEWLNNNGRILANSPERARINARLDIMHAAIEKAKGE